MTRTVRTNLYRRGPMFHRSAQLLCLTSLLSIAACSHDGGSGPSGPDAIFKQTAVLSAGAKCTSITQQQITSLFTPGLRGTATSGLQLVLNDLAAGNTAQAVTDMYKEWDFTLRSYYAGSLNGGTSPSAQTATLNFGKALYCLVGLDGSGLTLTTTSLDANNVVQVVFPSTSDQTVLTGSKHGGVLIPGNTLTQPVTISISLLPGSYTFPAGPLNTKLDQYGDFFEFTVVPAQAFTKAVTAAACIHTAGGDTPPASVDLAHNVGTGLEILPRADASFLDCGGTAMAPEPGVKQLLRNGQYGRAAAHLGTLALNLFAPTPAYAAASAIGGGTKSFSPFGGVDTAVVVQTAPGFPAQPQTAPAGSNVAAAPSVLVSTVNGHTPLGGASVVFAVTAGGGSDSTGGTAVTSATTLTNSSGIATAPFWTLGVGPANTLTATASFTLPTAISSFATSGASSAAGVVVTGNPITFSATSTDIVPYQASGYTFISGADGLLPGFEQPTFATTGWSQGQGAFGSGDAGGTVCPLDNDGSLHITWNNATAPTDMLLRKSFALPSWWSAPLTVRVAIDNDIQVFVNGHNETATASSGYDASSGFVVHEGCATLDSFTFSVPTSDLVHGTNLLAIRARDRGTIAYVDVRMSAQ